MSTDKPPVDPRTPLQDAVIDDLKVVRGSIVLVWVGVVGLALSVVAKFLSSLPTSKLVGQLSSADIKKSAVESLGYSTTDFTISVSVSLALIAGGAGTQVYVFNKLHDWRRYVLELEVNAGEGAQRPENEDPNNKDASNKDASPA